MKSRIAMAVVTFTATAGAASAEQMQITTSAERAPMRGPAETFTGDVKVKPWFPANEHQASSGALVEFTAGARSAWHTHPAGQTLVVMSGTGWVQEEGGVKRQIKAGDVIWTPPGVKHWHGATDQEAMSHIAITNAKDGANVTWMEQVTDENYLD
jgi:quercetin dioxygenase-like cupin family protein